MSEWHFQFIEICVCRFISNKYTPFLILLWCAVLWVVSIDQLPKGDDKTKRNLKIQQNNKFFVESEREREMERHKNHRTIFLAKCLKLNY